MGFQSQNVPQLDQESAQALAERTRSIWPPASRTLFRFGVWAAALMVRYEVVGVSVVALGYALFEVARAARPLWFDEIFTFQITRLPDLGNVFRAIPADGNPPLYYLLARISFRLLGETPFAVRLPSIMAFTVALVATYYFVRRRSGPVFGMFAMLALSCTAMSTDFGSEARPYALLAGFTSLTMLSWQAATEAKRHRVLPLMGMSLGIAGAIASHHYGVIHVGIPLICGEAVRLFKRRRFDAPLCIAGVAGLSMLSVTLPFATATRRVMLDYVKNSASFWAKPKVADLSSYGLFMCVWILLVFLVLLYLAHAVDSNQSDGHEQSADEEAGPPAHETAAALGLALLIPFMIGFTWLTTGYYMDRYAISAAIGIAILIGFVSARLGRNRRQAMAVAALCALLLTVRLYGAGARQFIALQIGKTQTLGLENEMFLRTAPGKEPIVMASAMEYGEDWFYGPPSLRERLHYLADLPYAIRQRDFLSELSLTADQPYILPKVDDYRNFLSTHNRFYVYKVGMPEQEWIMDRLISEGWTLKVVGNSEDTSLYLAQSPVK